MEKLKVLEAFGGIGACTQALKNLGIDFEVVDYIEIDKYACKSYNAINNTNFEPQDITEWDKDIDVDLIMHGSPCTNISVAGKQEGADEGSGTKSSLMYETLRIVEKLKPKYVVWENVKNLLGPKHRHNFDNYIKRMESLGYTSCYKVLNAKDYGVPQNRERVFTVSIRNDKGFAFPQESAEGKIDMVNIPQLVKVRKYEVDTKKLKETLREHKSLTNKEIADALNKPVTLVEHWFRKDGSFSIPDANTWPLLKELLGIKTGEFDASIMEFIEKPGEYEKSDRFYLDTGIAPTLTAASSDEKIIETFNFPEKKPLMLRLKDVLEESVDERYYLSEEKLDKLIGSITPENRKGNIIIEPDLKFVGGIGAKDWAGDGKRFSRNFPQGNRVYSEEGISCSVTANGGGLGAHSGLYATESPQFRVRRLTPKECFRLMGFPDEAYERASSVCSQSQLYKQAGNSICVPCLEAIFKNLFGTYLP